jgi:hypothetical protein
MGDWKRRRIAWLDHAKEGKRERVELAGRQRLQMPELGMIRYLR